MDGEEHRLQKFATHLHVGADLESGADHIVVAVGLHHGHAVLLLILAYLAAHAHTLGEHFEQLIVDLVDLLSQEGEVFGRPAGVAHHEGVEDEVEYLGGELLGGVAPGLVRGCSGSR